MSIEQTDLNCKNKLELPGEQAFTVILILFMTLNLIEKK